MKYLIYDEEVYPNVYTFAGKNYSTGEYYIFEWSERRNDMSDLTAFIDKLIMSDVSMVGFNNISYDYPVLHFICKNYPRINTRDVFNFSSSIIHAPKDQRFNHIVWSRDQLVRQIDLYKINHFDNMARQTSLKMLEYNMRSGTIEELPYTPSIPLTVDQIDPLILYNKKDVDETGKFFDHCIKAVRLRDELSKKFNLDLTNHNDTKIGKDYFIKRLEEHRSGICWDKSTGKRRPRQTKRSSIRLNEILLPYIKFERSEFVKVFDWFKNRTITETKAKSICSVNKKIDTTCKYKPANVKRSDYTYPFVGLPGKCCPTVPDVKICKITGEQGLCCTARRNPRACISAEMKPGEACSVVSDTGACCPGVRKNCPAQSGNLCAVINGFQFDFGTGGIHGSHDKHIARSDDQSVIVDVDVASYYPNLAISNKFHPHHLGETFCEIYKDMYDQRRKYAKGTPENAMFKLALNGTYGDSNSEYSPFYDPQFTMSITINGQLLLCMLAEQMIKIPGLEMIQINTDGLTFKVLRQHLEHTRKVCRWWETVTGLELEEALYSAMFIRNVNNYISVYDSGKIKRKGVYEYNLNWHQDHSMLVVPMAACDYFLHGTDPAEFLRNHDNMMDFMLRTKVPKSSRLELDGVRIQNITRYYISVDGGTLIKIMPPLKKNPTKERPMGINVGYKVTECNNIKNADPSTINYDFYEKEVKKLIKFN